jgi:shikimate kinase 2
MTISLTGFMGCGKSSIGRKLSALLSCSLVDLDEYIESKEGRPITEIFKAGGETAFRAIERSCLSEILSSGPAATLSQNDRKDDGRILVISLGGGTLTTPECAELVSEHTTCIYLRATIDTLVLRLEKDYGNRPMLASGQSGHDSSSLRARIEELIQKRSAVYEDTAHYIIDIDGRTDSDIVKEIVDMLQAFSRCR